MTFEAPVALQEGALQERKHGSRIAPLPDPLRVLPQPFDRIIRPLATEQLGDLGVAAPAALGHRHLAERLDELEGEHRGHGQRWLLDERHAGRRRARLEHVGDLPQVHELLCMEVVNKLQFARRVVCPCGLDATAEVPVLAFALGARRQLEPVPRLRQRQGVAVPHCR